jgi:hypothetical protein
MRIPKVVFFSPPPSRLSQTSTGHGATVAEAAGTFTLPCAIKATSLFLGERERERERDREYVLSAG